MEVRKIVVTRKIQLLIDTKDSEERKSAFKTLLDWRHSCFKAANIIIAHHYLLDKVKEMHYLVDDVKIKLANISKDEDGILTTSKANTTYQVLSKKYKNVMPMTILSALNTQLINAYSTDRSDYILGTKGVRNYKKTIPIPICPRSITANQLSKNGKYYTFSIHGILFRTYFGKDSRDKPEMWRKAITGEYKQLTSSLKIEGSKIFMLAVYEFEQNPADVNPNIVAEASLSMEIPISVKIGQRRYEIGNKEEYLHRRLAIQNARTRCQRASVYNACSHGRKKKMKSLTLFTEKEKNYISTKLHQYSKRLIQLCLNHNAATIILCDQTNKEEIAKQDAFILRNWTYHGLKDKILYKANRVGINVIVE